jgi:PAS domain S-box-containing protein
MPEVHSENLPFSASAARAWLAAIIDSSEDAIVSKNLNSIVTSWNAGAERMFGYSAEEMIGQSITRLIPEDRQGAARLSQTRCIDLRAERL